EDFTEAAISDRAALLQSPTTMLPPHGLPPVNTQSPADESRHFTPDMVDDSSSGKLAASSSIRQGSTPLAGESAAKTPVAAIPDIAAARSSRPSAGSADVNAAAGGAAGRNAVAG